MTAPRPVVRRLLAACVVCVSLGGCAGGRGEQPAATPSGPVVLRAYVYLDRDFVSRFGDRRGAGRKRLNEWLYQTERQLQAQYPIELRLAGVGAWELPAGAADGKAIFRKYVPASFPPASGANCLVAITGRKSVYWSGIAQWPRIFVKAQARAPVDRKTVAMLCHEISHWFGAVDIIDPHLPERSVMNYKDRTFGMVGGRIVWDRANQERIRRGVAAWTER